VYAYTGTAVNNLTMVAGSTTCHVGVVVVPCLSLTVTQGTAYSLQFAMPSNGGAQQVYGSFVWTVASNDAFSAAGMTFPAIGSTAGAHLEAGEPLANKFASGMSVWYRVLAPVSSVVAVVRDLSDCQCGKDL
jgi:hypothetical protein